MNSLILAGYVNSEPTPKNNALTFRMVVKYKGEIQNTFTVTAFSDLAEHLTGELMLGDRVLVKGHLENGGVVADDVGLSFHDKNPVGAEVD